MTTFTPFAPSSVAAFQFSPTLDGQICTCIITVNVAGTRYYINLYGQDGSLIVCAALVGSPDGLPLAAVEWFVGTVTAKTTEPHGYTVGSMIDLHISGCSPDAYNGDWRALILDDFTFKFNLQSDPGPIEQLGMEIYNVNLVAGYFVDSTLVFRTSSNNFEVTP